MFVSTLPTPFTSPLFSGNSKVSQANDHFCRDEQLYVFRMGERTVDRIEFEELALKSIDPSLGPRITHPTSAEMDSEQNQEKEKGGAGSGSGLATPLRVRPFSSTPSPTILIPQTPQCYDRHRPW